MSHLGRWRLLPKLFVMPGDLSYASPTLAPDPIQHTATLHSAPTRRAAVDVGESARCSKLISNKQELTEPLPQGSPVSSVEPQKKRGRGRPRTKRIDAAGEKTEAGKKEEGLEAKKDVTPEVCGQS